MRKYMTSLQKMFRFNGVSSKHTGSKKDKKVKDLGMGPQVKKKVLIIVTGPGPWFSWISTVRVVVVVERMDWTCRRLRRMHHSSWLCGYTRTHVRTHTLLRSIGFWTGVRCLLLEKDEYSFESPGRCRNRQKTNFLLDWSVMDAKVVNFLPVPPKLLLWWSRCAYCLQKQILHPFS